MTGTVRDPSWITQSDVLCNVEWISVQMIHSFNKQIKFTSQGYNNETLPSVWPQSEGGNTDTVYCCQWKFTLLFSLPLRASLRHKGYFVWHLATIVIIIYLFLPCLFFSSRNSPTSELIINRVHERAPGSGRWATDKGYTKLERVHLRVNDSGLITAACCRGKEGGWRRYSFDISVSGILITPYYPALFVVCFKD